MIAQYKRRMLNNLITKHSKHAYCCAGNGPGMIPSKFFSLSYNSMVS